MKLYYTIIQPFEHGSDFTKHLRNQGVDYTIGAEIKSEIDKHPVWTDHQWITKDPDQLFMKYTVLIDEYELSALKLTYDQLRIVKNRPGLEFKNKMRGMFKLFLK